MGDKVVRLAGTPKRYYLAMIEDRPATCKLMRYAAHFTPEYADMVLRHLRMIDAQFNDATLEEWKP